MKSITILFIIIITFLSDYTIAQVNFGADVMSRYIWRGVDYGNSPSFQPSITFKEGAFKIGTWGAYSFAGEGSVFSEHDVFCKLYFESNAGTFSFIYTDYYYPSEGLKYFNFSGKGEGAHTMEAGFSFNGPVSFPIQFSAYLNFYNDPDYSTYFQAGYPIETDEVSLLFFAGLSGKRSVWYGTSKAAVINVGISFLKQFYISEKLSLPISASLIVNPDLEQSYLIFGFSI
jgi:hypothetical protein